MKYLRKGVMVFLGIIVCIGLYIGIVFIDLEINEDDYLDNDHASRVMMSYGGKEDTLEYNIMACNYEGVKKSLKEKQNLNRIVDTVGMSPLILASTLPKLDDVYKMSELLIKNGADVNFCDDHGANILFYIIYDKNGDIEVPKEKLLKYYLKKGADKNITINNIDKNDPDLKGSATLLEFCKRKGFSHELEVLEENEYE